MSILNKELVISLSPQYRKPQNSVPATSVRRNPICRRFFSHSALGAKFEVVVRVVSAIKVTLRHHRVAFPAKMFVNHRRLKSKSAPQHSWLPAAADRKSA
jgi:hypothetical protein